MRRCESRGGNRKTRLHVFDNLESGGHGSELFRLVHLAGWPAGFAVVAGASAFAGAAASAATAGAAPTAAILGDAHFASLLGHCRFAVVVSRAVTE